jgi:hypothetical protein
MGDMMIDLATCSDFRLLSTAEVGRYMRSKAVPDEQIALFLGHIQPPQSVQTTIIYSPYSPLYLREAKDAAEAFVREIARHCRKHDVLQPPWTV